MRGLLAVLLLGLAGAAGAATKTCASGTLTSTHLTTIDVTHDVVMARAAPGLLVQVTAVTGTAAAQLEVSCDGSFWALVQNSTMSLVSPNNSQAVSVLQPTSCAYRVNVTACTGCEVNVLYACSGP